MNSVVRVRMTLGGAGTLHLTKLSHIEFFFQSSFHFSNSVKETGLAGYWYFFFF